MHFSPSEKFGISDRIFNGYDASVYQFPYQAYLRDDTLNYYGYFGPSNDYGFSCGASIIHDYFALTAAHCIKGYLYATQMLEANT